VKKADGTVIYNCWTQNKLFKIKNPVGSISSIIEESEHFYGRVPIIEYPANNARLGAFEIVLSLLDAINAAFSDLADGREQFINSLLVIKGADITDEQFAELRSQGGLKVPADGDVKYLVSELNQTQNGETINLMIDTMLEIVGMPKRSGANGGTSDNGIAVILRDGFADAEARAADTERIFKKSENEFLRIALRISNAMRGMTLQLASVEPHFTRQNTDNLLAKVQALTTMLASEKIHPRLAWQLSTLVSDPESAYTISQEYEQSRIEQEEQLLSESTANDHSEDSDGGDDA
jgi:SPP1 family phage portal protein